jgi:D-alanyl-lipoteichoic acid acyltransferase DltB (MBOAT superfamily)
MLFNTLEFIIFFPIVVMIYFALPYRFRWMLLLAASCYFYMCWKAEYILLLFLSTSIDYWAALQMSHTAVQAQRKRYLLLSLFTNLGILFAFKYFNLFNETARALFNQFNIFYGVPAFELLLPVGISFYTFHALSYTIDVYHGIRPPEKHLGMFMLYVTFFPQLVAGPISRAHTMLPELYKKYDFDYRRVVSGLQLIIWGFFKKVVIADTLGVYVNAVYNSPGEHYGLPVILATYFFAFQIYCDFSGYTDIAIGSAQIMGYNLMENFRRPYLSRSISEFWKRWHISLSTWFRDYLYIPLGGNKVPKWRWYFNLFIVFLISGLWHGANWTFVVWGALHGAYLVCSLWTSEMRVKVVQFFGLSRLPTVHRYLQIFITFHLVLLGWIFFRANSISDAFLLLTNMFHIELLDINPAHLSIDVADGMGTEELIIAFFSVLFLIAVHMFEESRGSVRTIISSKPLIFRWALYVTLVLAILNLGMPQEIPFIYFQF